MRIVVFVKQTFDTEAVIKLDHEGNIIEDDVKKTINPYDELAIEEAVRIKERQGADITAISVGCDKADDALRQALAMGADRAVWINDPIFEGGDGYSRARVLARAVDQIEYDLILAGWVSIDDGCAETAVRVAEILDIPQVTVAKSILIINGEAVVEKETDEGMEKQKVSLPALVTVQKGINEPRYPNFKAIMQSKKKELTRIKAEDLKLNKIEVGSAVAKTTVARMTLPNKRTSCKMIEGQPTTVCRQLVELLQIMDDRP